MAALTAFLTAHAAEIAAIVVAVIIGWVNRDKIKAKFSGGGMQADGGIDLSNFLDLFKKWGADIEEKKEAVDRSFSLVSLVRLEAEIDELPISETDKAEGRDCIKKLGSLLLVPHDDSVPVPVAKA